MARTLSAWWRSPVALARLHLALGDRGADGGDRWDPRGVLRLLQEPRGGRPAPLTRLIALLVVVAMVSLAAPAVIPVVGWVLSLL